MITPEEKKRMFDQTRMAIHAADVLAAELHRGSAVTPDGASHLLSLCLKANASAQAFERVMRGIEPARVG